MSNHIADLSSSTARLFKPLNLHEDDRLRIDTDGKNFIVRAFSINKDGRESWPSYEAGEGWVLRIPERKRLEMHGKWWLGGTDFTAIVIHHLWPEHQLIITDEAMILYKYLLTRFLSQTHLAETRAKYAATKEVENFRFQDSSEFPLLSYQRVALQTCMNQEGSALFMEQGTGKTPIVIARICNEALKAKKQYRVLIVCPKNGKSNWRDELGRFHTVAGKIAILRGGQLERLKTLIAATQIDDTCKWVAVISSYETVVRSWDAIKLIEWDLCVLDESHYIKSMSAKRTAKMMELRHRCRQRMVLTGTAITNSVLDIFSQLEFLGEGQSGFTHWRQFKYFYGNYMQLGQFEKLTGYKNLPLLQERMSRLSFSISKKDALTELPEKVYDTYDIEMTPQQAKLYKQIQTQLAVEIQNELDRSENKQLVVNNILTKLLRLAQVTSGFISWDPIITEDGVEVTPRTVERLDPNPKLEALVELLKEKGPDDKTAIWSCWVQDIKSIRARLELEGIDAVTYYGSTSDHDREEAVRRFNTDPKCRVFIGNPAAGGTVINLHGYDTSNPESTSNCNHVIYFSQNWSMVTRAQSEDRCHRKGTRTNVRYTDLCVPGSIDEEIRMRVLHKRIVSYHIQDLHTILDSILKSSVKADDE